MAVTNTFVNDTTGEASEVNQNFTDVVIHRKQFSDATSRTHTGNTSITSSGTAFGLKIPIGSLILAVTARFGLKTSNAAYTASCSILFGSANKRLECRFTKYGTGDTAGSVMGVSSSYNSPFTTKNESNISLGGSASIMEEIVDATTTFNFQIAIDNAGETVTLGGANLDILYVETYTDD